MIDIQVHHRQPGLIQNKDFDAWLDDASAEPEKFIYQARGSEIQFIQEVPPIKNQRGINAKIDNNLRLF